jgi:hypothetical protein
LYASTIRLLHFVFVCLTDVFDAVTIESVGQISPRQIFEEAIKVFLTKIEVLASELQKLPQAGHM